jgi:endonuclease/exonuclease/phosphatase family metal-dependent hydrolase
MAAASIPDHDGMPIAAIIGWTTVMRAAITLGLPLVLAACSDGSDNAIGLRATAQTPDVTVASLNVLHGLTCPPETADCRLADRQDLLFDWIESIACPDVVLLQEVTGPRVIAAVTERVASRCDAVYLVLEPPSPVGQNFILTRHPVLQTNEDRLMAGLRILWHAQIDHPTGIVDVFNTHLAAGIDLQPCDAACPQECRDAGAVNSRECQAIQVAILTQQRAAPDSLRILGGDFNANPESFVYQHIVDGNGRRVTYLEAGNPECDAPTGTGCTSGREDADLGDMESPANGVRSRIDYLFVQMPTVGAASCRYELDSHRDDDGDGLATRIFADDPNPFAQRCGPLPEAICWPSDHEGMQADFNCL